MMIVEVNGKWRCYPISARSCAENVIVLRNSKRRNARKMHGKCTQFCTSFCTKNARRKRDRNAQTIPVTISISARHSACVLPQTITKKNN